MYVKDVLVQNGVDESAILKEDQATFTWENAKNSRIVTDQNKLVIQKAILCCRNVHARRSLMYYQKSFPEAKIFVSPSVIGNVTKENIARLTGLGVNYVSSGALTHSAPIMDLSMKNLHAVE